MMLACYNILSLLLRHCVPYATVKQQCQHLSSQRACMECHFECCMLAALHMACHYRFLRCCGAQIIHLLLLAAETLGWIPRFSGFWGGTGGKTPLRGDLSWITRSCSCPRNSRGRSLNLPLPPSAGQTAATLLCFALHSGCAAVQCIPLHSTA